ncbi:UNVERIFIED_CONTAM: hypothetical protein DES50_102636 [Williamsia faeni]
MREAPQTFVSGDRFASIRDPYGIRWSVMNRVEDLSGGRVLIPLALRIAELQQERPDASADLDLVGQEINIRRDHGTDYGCTGYVLRPREVDR